MQGKGNVPVGFFFFQPSVKQGHQLMECGGGLWKFVRDGEEMN